VPAELKLLATEPTETPELQDVQLVVALPARL